VTLEDQEKRMRKTNGWTALRTAAIALGLCTWAANAVEAAPVKSASTFIDYSTTGSVSLTGVTGKNVVSFKVAGGAFTAPSTFSLGEFLVNGLAEGESTTYDNTPFSITYLTQMVDHGAPTPNETPITLTGVLNGTFTGPSQSNVVATFDPTTQSLFRTGPFLNALSILGNTVSLVPSTTNGGRTTVQGQIIVSAAPIPEPASIAVFALASAAGLIFRRRIRARG